VIAKLSSLAEFRLLFALMHGLPEGLGKNINSLIEKRGAFQLSGLNHTPCFEDKLPMAHMLYLKTCLSIFVLLLFSGNSFAQRETPSPRGAINWLYTRPNFYDTKLTDTQKIMLAPLPEEVARYAGFLKQKDTGIVRLHPKGKYEATGRVVSVQESTKDVLPIPGGGAYYSFQAKTNKRGPWSEIYLENNRLQAYVTGKLVGLLNQPEDVRLEKDGDMLYAGRANKAVGILTRLGDVALESVGKSTPGLDYLTQLSPPQTHKELLELIEKSSRGFSVDDFAYSSAADATPDTTYVMRSILYSKDGYVVFPGDPYYRLRSYTLGYDGSDILVAFRIIRRHQDDSITLVWKRLEKFGKPKIKDTFRTYSQDDIRRLLDSEIVKGIKLSQVNAFLDKNGFERLDYQEVGAEQEVAPGIKGFVYASLPHIERKTGGIIFDLFLRFDFNEKQELVDWSMKKTRRSR
jgi:hypothetical protein